MIWKLLDSIPESFFIETANFPVKANPNLQNEFCEVVLFISEKGWSQIDLNWGYKVDGEVFPMCN